MRMELIMIVEYGPKYDIFAIDFVSEIKDGEIRSDVRVPIKGRDIYLGFAEDGKLVQSEILEASGVLRAETLAAADPMDETPVRSSDSEKLLTSNTQNRSLWRRWF